MREAGERSWFEKLPFPNARSHKNEHHDKVSRISLYGDSRLYLVTLLGNVHLESISSKNGNSNGESCSIDASA